MKIIRIQEGSGFHFVIMRSWVEGTFFLFIAE